MKLIDLNYGENYKEEIDLKHLLERQLADDLGLPDKRVLINYGANSNLLLFFSTFSAESLFKKKRRLKVLLDYPNYFFTIRQIEEWHINPIYIKRDKNFELSIDQFIKSIKNKNPDIIVLTTPNNPTGKPIEDKDIERIIRVTPKETIILIDRSCVNTLPEISSKEIFEKFKNRKLVVVKSYSKSHSMSDKRAGYMATNSKEIAKLLFRKADLNHNLSALQYLKQNLNNKKMFNEKRKIIKECNNLMKSFFDKLSETTYFQSYSNFAVVQLPPEYDSAFVEEHLEKKKILVMGGHKIGLGANYIRVHMSGVEKIKSFILEYEMMLTI